MLNKVSNSFKALQKIKSDTSVGTLGNDPDHAYLLQQRRQKEDDIEAVKKQKDIYKMFNGEDQKANKKSIVLRVGKHINDMKESDMSAPTMGSSAEGPKKPEEKKSAEVGTKGKKKVIIKKVVSGINSVTLPR